MSCGAMVPKNPACVPGLLLRRKAALSGVSEYFACLCFFRRSRPTSAVFQGIENFVVHTRADDQRRRVSEANFHQTFGRDLFFPANFLGHIGFEISGAKIDK
jgi:hypothetical protein